MRNECVDFIARCADPSIATTIAALPKFYHLALEVLKTIRPNDPIPEELDLRDLAIAALDAANIADKPEGE